MALLLVSIQLVSPASGEPPAVPWVTPMVLRLVSIQLVSTASGELHQCQHLLPSLVRVSIQLVSPASGELRGCVPRASINDVSIQLVSPASGELSQSLERKSWEIKSFHSISFPSEWGDYTGELSICTQPMVVSIQLVSPASGE